MKKLILFFVLAFSINIRAQNKVFLHCRDNKIQLYGGAFPELYGLYGGGGWGVRPYFLGLEASHKAHNLGFNTTFERGILMQSKAKAPVSNYERHLSYYGYRIANRFLSASINGGLGYVWLSKPGYFHNSWQRNQSPCAELFLKLDLTKRANGLGFILSANFNKWQPVIDAHIILQLGSDWDSKKKRELQRSAQGI